MSEIGSREYAEWVEDIICNNLEDALSRAFDFIARELGIIPDYYKRDLTAQKMLLAFQEGVEATWRDQAIELFEMYGLDIRPDGKEW